MTAVGPRPRGADRDGKPPVRVMSPYNWPMRASALLSILALSTPIPASAWGFEAHKLIADKAVDLLPPELGPAFAARRVFVVERSIDPDLWRTAGWPGEDANHFVDLDHPAFGPDPFAGLPRDYRAAVDKFGRDFVQRQGLLPWRVAEFQEKLRKEFEALRRQPPPAYAVDNIAFYAAVLAHYVADAHVPLHATVNHDGQLTGQNGLHSRWETELFERTRARLAIRPAAPRGVANPRDFMFDVLLASNREVAGVLAADRKATEGREFYDDAYFEAFAAGTRSVLERRLNDAITAVAAVVIGAWEQAGRPVVPAAMTRTPRRIPRPRP